MKKLLPFLLFSTMLGTSLSSPALAQEDLVVLEAVDESEKENREVSSEEDAYDLVVEDILEDDIPEDLTADPDNGDALVEILTIDEIQAESETAKVSETEETLPGEQDIVISEEDDPFSLLIEDAEEAAEELETEYFFDFQEDTEVLLPSAEIEGELSVAGLAEDAEYQTSRKKTASLFPANAAYRLSSAISCYTDLEDGSAYYGSQLTSSNAIAIYNALYENWANGETGDVTVTLPETLSISMSDETAEYFTTWRNDQTTENHDIFWKALSAQDNYNKELVMPMQSAFDGLIYDHPEVFWVKSISYSISLAISSSSDAIYCKITTVTLKKSETYYTDACNDVAAFQNALNAAYAEAAAQFTGEMQASEKAKVIHDYLCELLYYEENNYAHTAAGAFLYDHKVVCEGYAKAFKLLCNKAGISCILVVGNTTSACLEANNHMWNAILCEDGNWYIVDNTWDDRKDGTYTYDYFYCGTNQIPSRVLYTNFSGTIYTQNFSYPSFSSDTYHLKTVTKEAVQVDCTHDGLTEELICVLCGKVCQEQTVMEEALGHDYASEYTTDRVADCTTAGSISRHCSRCGAVTGVTSLPALGHSYNAGKVTKAAVCTTAGVRTYTCQRSGCKAQKTETIPALGHSYDAGKVTKEAACTETGILTYTCQRAGCGKTRTEVLPALGHDFESELTVDREAACTEDGIESRHCTRCLGQTDTTILPAEGHAEETKLTPAAYGQAGSRITFCSICGEVLSQEKIAGIALVRLSKMTYIYNGKAQKPSVTVTDTDQKKISADQYQVTYSSGRKKAGTYTVTIRFLGDYSGSIQKTFTIKKASQKITVKISSKTYKVSALKKGKKTFSLGAKASTALSYQSAKPKYVTVSKKGKVTVKKKTPKGTYTILISAKATQNYKAAAKKVKVKVK